MQLRAARVHGLRAQAVVAEALDVGEKCAKNLQLARCGYRFRRIDLALVDWPATGARRQWRRGRCGPALERVGQLARRVRRCGHSARCCGFGEAHLPRAPWRGWCAEGRRGAPGQLCVWRARCDRCCRRSWLGMARGDRIVDDLFQRGDCLEGGCMGGGSARGRAVRLRRRLHDASVRCDLLVRQPAENAHVQLGRQILQARGAGRGS